jgi:DNA-binding MarR family transcriptional regulator
VELKQGEFRILTLICHSDMNMSTMLSRDVFHSDKPLSARTVEPNRREALARLFAEVNSLSIRLRTTFGLRHSAQERPAGEKGVLQALERHGPRTVPQIGQVRHTSRQNIQILVNRLAADGYIELTTNPAHKRSPLVQLTEKGRVWLGGTARREDQALEPVLASMDDAQVNAAAECLRAIREVLTGKPKEREMVHRQQLRRPSYKEQGAVVAQSSEEPAPVLAEETELPISLL